MFVGGGDGEWGSRRRWRRRELYKTTPGNLNPNPESHAPDADFLFGDRVWGKPTPSAGRGPRVGGDLGYVGRVVSWGGEERCSECTVPMR